MAARSMVAVIAAGLLMTVSTHSVVRGVKDCSNDCPDCKPGVRYCVACNLCYLCGNCGKCGTGGDYSPCCAPCDDPNYASHCFPRIAPQDQCAASHRHSPHSHHPHKHHPCADAQPRPPGDDPLLQHARPPQQTPQQKAVRSLNIREAANKSAAAGAWVRHHLETAVKPSIRNISAIANASTDELLSMLRGEFAHQTMLHNAPLQHKAKVQDDSNLKTTLSNGYLQNVVQRYVLGVETRSALSSEANDIQVQSMHYEPFKNPMRPTLREANSRVLYLASNWLKSDCGNFIYGEITYVINPIYRDQFFIAPFDTGAYANSYKHQYGREVPYGTLDHFLHLIEPHIQIYGEELKRKHIGSYSLANMFQRWYGGAPGVYEQCTGAPPCVCDKSLMHCSYLYFEVEWSGNAWLPESLLYIIPKYNQTGESQLWGTANGLQLQRWSETNRRPLVWSDGSDTGMIIDPVVWSTAFATNPSITQEMLASFRSLWQASPRKPFKHIYSQASPKLRLRLPNYLQRHICEPHESDPNVMVLGTNDAGECVFWRSMGPPVFWECLNDGTCGQSIGAGRGQYNSEQACLDACAKQRWVCQRNIDKGKAYGGADARSCVANPLGACQNLTECEHDCYGAALSPEPEL